MLVNKRERLKHKLQPQTTRAVFFSHFRYKHIYLYPLETPLDAPQII